MFKFSYLRHELLCEFQCICVSHFWKRNVCFARVVCASRPLGIQRDWTSMHPVPVMECGCMLT